MQQKDEVDALAAVWAQHLPPQTVTALEVTKRVSRIGMIFSQALGAELAELGLTYAEFDVLAALYRIGPMKPSELSKSLFLTSGGISNVLQRMTTAGYVERSDNPGDARSRLVRLTEEGGTMAKAALDASARSCEEVTAGVPEEALRQAADALRDILLVIGKRRLR
ncbi:MarR family winged helix-turn-helix transcriptional regulator [Nonomuraea sp. NPDC050556]|uniref:MarR family winged helix-turn-helix transcriptional regulator n=1 Tax=Nonomuraea sp. NPDC050556 TaxID=3364369 RepID=UPI00379F20C8